MDDILIELSDTDLEQLVKMYEKHRKELPYLYSFLHICVKSKKIGMPDFVKVWSPNNWWKIEGTFIASVPVRQMGALQTLEQYKLKGYAALAVKKWPKL
ncbi:unnamed protein product [Ceutorhynchus assimilis]|uniref:Uncharacterized protein n=1 Tax=Ceutorhynchus assimilis TaxID=467358 RepID=A0A9N9Q9K6_9CUCU|nr:unnamed protein product [Ceutorhynchus assimilis]